MVAGSDAEEGTGVMNTGIIPFPFITHPFLRQLIEEIDKNPDLVYSITDHGKPIAIIISPVAYERAMRELDAAGKIKREKL